MLRGFVPNLLLKSRNLALISWTIGVTDNLYINLRGRARLKEKNLVEGKEVFHWL